MAEKTAIAYNERAEREVVLPVGSNHNACLQEQRIMAACHPIDVPSTLPIVEFRHIESFHGYAVGNDGYVWSIWTHNGHQRRRIGNRWKRMRPQPDGEGYLGVNLFRDGKPYRRKVHLLVLRAFFGPRPKGLEACHNNGRVWDCHMSNLRWDTHSSNMRDRLKHGTDGRGAKNGNAKLTEDRVREIKAALRYGETKKSIAQRYGVSPSCVSGIARGVLWSWLED